MQTHERIRKQTNLIQYMINKHNLVLSLPELIQQDLVKVHYLILSYLVKGLHFIIIKGTNDSVLILGEANK